MSEENDDNNSEGEATFAPGQDIFDTQDEDLKTVGDYLVWLQKGIQFSHGILYQMLQQIADFHHDQAHAHHRLMDSLAEMLPDPETNEDDPGPEHPSRHLTVVD
jgi:hypothetical protein